MLHKQSMFEPRDMADDKKSDKLAVGRAAVSNSPGASPPKDSSITLWGPGVKVPHETPSSIMTQSLHVWRKDNAQLPADKAAEALHNMYENLPPEALELTFQDMVRRNSPKRKPVDKAGKNSNKSPTKSKGIDRISVVTDVEQANNASKEKDSNGPTVKNASKQNENGPKVSMFAKIAEMLSTKEVHVPSNKTTITQEQLDKLLERRRRKPAGSDREGLYSESSTPTTSFRRVSPLNSPKLSPSPSFHELMQQVDGHSFRGQLAKSDRFLESHLDEGGMPPFHEASNYEVPKTPKRTTRGKDANYCSACSTTNLFFLKTTCRVCGRAFCPSCKNTETSEVFGGRICKNKCVVEQSADHVGSVKEITKRTRRRRALWKIGLGSCIRGES